MAGSLNKCLIIGNTGRDPEMRYTPTGTPVCTFSVACSDKRDDKEHTEWFNVVTWNKLAETVNQYLTKGQRVYVEGRLQTRTWEGSDGQKHSRTEVVANTVLFLSPKSGQTDRADDSIDDIPF